MRKIVELVRIICDWDERRSRACVLDEVEDAPLAIDQHLCGDSRTMKGVSRSREVPLLGGCRGELTV
jgi:hypothetical protein